MHNFSLSQHLNRKRPLFTERTSFFIALFVGVVMFGVFGYFLVKADSGAKLVIHAEDKTFAVGEKFDATITLDTNRRDVVAVRVIVRFPADQVKFIDTDMSRSVFADGNECFDKKLCRKIDVSGGEIEIVLAKPHPGVNVTEGVISKLQFEALQPVRPTDAIQIYFETSGSMNDSDVIADDGMGTDILNAKEMTPIHLDHNVSVGDEKGSFTKGGTEIFSNDDKVKFHAEDASLAGYGVEILSGSDVVATTTADADGKWSVNVKVKSKKSSSKKYSIRYTDLSGESFFSKSITVRTDTKDPEFTDLPVKLRKRAGEKIWWTATDDDRVEKYVVTFNGKTKHTEKKSFLVPTVKPGVYGLSVKAFDRSGNTAIRKVEITIY